MAREAPRRLGGALGEALVVVRLAKQAVAVPVGALVRHLRCTPAGLELLPRGQRGARSLQGPGPAAQAVVPAIVAGQ